MSNTRKKLSQKFESRAGTHSWESAALDESPTAFDESEKTQCASPGYPVQPERISTITLRAILSVRRASGLSSMNAVVRFRCC
jgi:hypothetical protein